MSGDVQYGHGGMHHGVGTPDCPRELHHHHDERCEPPGAMALRDRRQRAREAYYDGDGLGTQGLDDAIETATRVQVTPGIVRAARAAFEDHYGGSVRPIIAAAFRAAGFEVEE